MEGFSAAGDIDETLLSGMRSRHRETEEERKRIRRDSGREKKGKRDYAMLTIKEMLSKCVSTVNTHSKATKGGA